MAPSRNTAAGWRLAVALLVAATLASGSVVTPAGLPVNSLQQPPMPPTQAPNVAVLERAVPGGSGFIPITPSPAVPVVAPDAAPTSSRDGRQLSTAAPETGNWRLVGKLLMDCSRSGDLIGCLKVKAVATLGRALASDAPIPIMEDLALARDPEAEVAAPGSEAVQSESELEATLPRSMEERSGRLDKLLLDRLDAFIRSRTVQFSVPLGMGLFEGRGKKDKKGGYAMMLVAAMAGMYMQMAMGGMAMMSGKALIVAKIALALAAVCLLKKSGGGGGGDHSQGGLGGKKGMGGYVLLLVAGMKAMMMQSAMGGIAMMSGKALIIAKIALLLALLCCLKKGGGEESKAQIVYAAPAEHGSSGGGGWQSGGGGDWNRRSATTDPNYAQSYAYSAHQRY